MENLIANDTTCKIILNLNDKKDEHAAINFNFKKGEDYSSVVYDEFTRANIPLILLDELSPLIEVFIQEDKRAQCFYNTEENELLKLNSASKDIQAIWQMRKRRVDDMKLEEKEMKTINSSNNDWKKLVLLKHFNKDEELIQFENKVISNIELYEKQKNEEEMILSSIQEKEMMEVNMNDKPIDLIANEHLNQLRQFKYNSRRELAELLLNAHDSYIILINKLFSLYKHICDPNDTSILNEANFKKGNSSSLDNHLLFNHKLSFGSYIRQTINMSVYSVPDLIQNSLKAVLSKEKLVNSTTLNDIFKSSNAFGCNLHAILNFFTYDFNEKGMSYLLNSSKIINKTVSNELFFESNANTFLQLENIIIQTEKAPNDYDIITTKHSNTNSYDLMLNVYLSNFRKITEDDLLKSLGNVIYFTNAYSIQTLIIPLDKIMEKVFKCTQESEFKIYMKHFKNIMAMINQAYQTIIKLGLLITTKSIVFETTHSFVLDFEKCNSFDAFSFSFNQFFIKG